MKMKKVVSLLLTGAMSVAVLAGCGGSGSSAPASGSATAEKAEEAAAPAEAGTEEAAPADGATWKIGGIGPITGPAAQYGSNVMNSGQIAVDEINAAGGINGYQISYQFQDDEHDAEKAVNAYNTLKDWGMQILMGTVTSTPCAAVGAETSVDNMFQLTPSGSSEAAIAYDNAFRLCFSDPNQGKASALYIGQNSLASNVAIIYKSSDVYSSGIYETFVAESSNQPFEVVAAEAFTDDSNTDFSVQLQKAQQAGADLVFLPIYYQEASIILKQANDMGYDPIFFGVDGMDGILGLENFDTSLAEGVMLLTPFIATASDDLTKNFVSTYQGKHGEIPNQFGADAYDCMYVLKAAIEKANLTPDMSTSDICEALKVSMTEISVDGLTGAGMVWTADGEPNKDPKAAIIQNGEYVIAE